MAAPAGWSLGQLVFETQFGYAGMGASPAAPNQGAFVVAGVPAPDTSVGFLNDWNFGMEQETNSVWSASGKAPYWGSATGDQEGNGYAAGSQADYAYPGNVFQTSAGANSSLFGGYSPQTFTSQGSGLSLQDVYVGGPQVQATESNGSTYDYEWTGGIVNTEGKRYFPFGTATEFYLQVKAQMAGPNNGSWSSIYILPDTGEGGTGNNVYLQEFNYDGPNADEMVAKILGTSLLPIGIGTASSPLYAGYHVYGCDLNTTTSTVTAYLDGVSIGSYTGTLGSKYFLVLDAAVSSGQQPWQTSVGFVTNSDANMAMSVAEVQVYQQ